MLRAEAAFAWAGAPTGFGAICRTDQICGRMSCLFVCFVCSFKVSPISVCLGVLFGCFGFGRFPPSLCHFLSVTSLLSLRRQVSLRLLVWLFQALSVAQDVQVWLLKARSVAVTKLARYLVTIGW